MRKYLIAGNWKMNAGPSEASQLIKNIRKELANKPIKSEVLVCPPFISIPAVQEELSGLNSVLVGAQNVHFEDNGAYTGELSTQMLKEAGCRYVIIGHSERRAYFGETDETVNKKAKKSLNDGLKPIICVGESLEQRKAGEHEDLVKKQVTAAFAGIDAESAKKVVVAYEPIWAIGTGETASPEQAQEMHEIIRKELAGLYNDETASAIRVLYGGSMKPENAADLLGQPDVDGGLIGGASLKAHSFVSIINTAESYN